MNMYPNTTKCLHHTKHLFDSCDPKNVISVHIETNNLDLMNLNESQFVFKKMIRISVTHEHNRMIPPVLFGTVRNNV